MLSSGLRPSAPLPQPPQPPRCNWRSGAFGPHGRLQRPRSATGQGCCQTPHVNIARLAIPAQSAFCVWQGTTRLLEEDKLTITGFRPDAAPGLSSTVEAAPTLRAEGRWSKQHASLPRQGTELTATRGFCRHLWLGGAACFGRIIKLLLGTQSTTGSIRGWERA